MIRINKQRCLKAIATCLVAVMVVCSAGRGRALAMTIPTRSVVTMDRAQDERTIQSTLERREIQQRLSDLGYKADDISKKMSRLSDEQTHQVAMQLNQQVPAGDGGASLWIILGAVLLLILLIAAIDDNDHDHDRHHDDHTNVDVHENQPAPQPAQQPPQTIIVK
jgi:hypothetical protein